ncbi:hypothetical protein S301_24915 [Salmonella enterica subsp. enterica]|uniref:DUF4123 domain-containing protein n=1 Tax=Salmonella enterica I TaxID=59201 RepID=A0A5U3EZB3_SALET|nr:hypothetical protein [Salmonella enterica subsp. enterica]
MTIMYDFSPQAVTQQADVLLTQVQAAITERQEYVYLLIDREALPEDMMHPFICALMDQRPVPVTLPHRNLSMDRHPWLIPLDLTQATHHALLESSIRHALEEQHPDRLYNGGGRAVCGWHYPDGDGRLVSHDHSPSPYPYMTFSLMVNPEDEIHISQTGKIVRVLEHYRQAHINKPRHDEATAVTIIRRALKRAQQLHGFDNDTDQQALALDCLRLHPELDMHPRMKILLSPREWEPDTDYAICTGALSDRDWQQLCHDLNTEETNASASDARSPV